MVAERETDRLRRKLRRFYGRSPKAQRLIADTQRGRRRSTARLKGYAAEASDILGRPRAHLLHLPRKPHQREHRRWRLLYPGRRAYRQSHQPAPRRHIRPGNHRRSQRHLRWQTGPFSGARTPAAPGIHRRIRRHFAAPQNPSPPHIGRERQHRPGLDPRQQSNPLHLKPQRQHGNSSSRISAIPPPRSSSRDAASFRPRLSPDGSHVLYLSAPTPDAAASLRSKSWTGGPPQLVLQERAAVTNYQCARTPSQLCIISKIVGPDHIFVAFDLEHGTAERSQGSPTSPIRTGPYRQTAASSRSSSTRIKSDFCPSGYRSSTRRHHRQLVPHQRRLVRRTAKASSCKASPQTTSP